MVWRSRNHGYYSMGEALKAVFLEVDAFEEVDSHHHRPQSGYNMPMIVLRSISAAAAVSVYGEFFGMTCSQVLS